MAENPGIPPDAPKPANGNGPMGLPPPLSEQLATPAFWTPPRRELLDWFQTKAPHLAALYEAAVVLFHNDTFPAREQFVAHAVREIGNNLPNAVGVQVERTRIDTTARLNEIISTWRQDGLPIDFSPPVTATGAVPDNESGVVLPLRTAQAMLDLVRDHAQSHETRADAAIRLLREIAPDKAADVDQLRPAALQWLAVLTWFVKHVHVGDRARPISEADFQRQFDLFEQHLGAMLRPYFSKKKELHDFLDEANR